MSFKAFGVPALAFGLALSFICAEVHAGTPDLDRRIWEANQVLKEALASPDRSIPDDLLAKCQGIAIYPNVIRGGFIFGMRFGSGVVLSKDPATGQWGPVSFSSIGGGNFGLQIGAQATDLILVIMNERGMHGVLSNQFTLGADASVAAGPLGRHSEAATDLTLSAGIVSYSRSRGLFAGIAIDGAILGQDNKANYEYYGKPVNAKDILLGAAVEIKESSQPLVDTLNQYSSAAAAK